MDRFACDWHRLSSTDLTLHYYYILLFAIVNTIISFTPDFFNIFVHSPIVAPVVITSSINKTLLFFISSLDVTSNAPIRFFILSSFVNFFCSFVCFTFFIQLLTGIFKLYPISFAISLHWLEKMKGKEDLISVSL